jgi:hypothetical protein
MHFKLISPADEKEIFDVPENRGFSRALVVEQLASRASDSYEVIDGSRFSDAERARVYSAEAMAAAGNRYRIRRVFGSNRASMGPFLGKQIPALICYDGDRPVDVFPHEDRDGVLATIADYLASGS